MRTLKVIKIDGNDFTYSLEPGAEIIGTAKLPQYSILALVDKDEPATIKHRFISVTVDSAIVNEAINFEDSEHKIKPDETLAYIGTISGETIDHVVFEVVD